MSDDRLLNNLLHLLSPHHHLDAALTVAPDYVIDAPVGCFRVAYSPTTHCTALFYARHPNDLAGRCVEDGGLEIAHPERLYLVKMFDVHHGATSKWNDSDNRQQFDLTWIRREITRINHDLPRILFREAVLHQLTPDTYSSAFVGYRRNGSGPMAPISIVTESRKNFQLVDVTHHRAARLKVTNMEGRRRFSSDETPEAVAGDFAVRLAQIWDGHDPVRWREAPLRPAQRAIEAMRAGMTRQSLLERLAEHTTWRGAARDLTHTILGGPLAFLEAELVDAFAKIGKRATLDVAPERWHHLISKHASRLAVDSKLHQVLVRPSPEHFGDLQWLDPERHSINFVVRDNTTPNHIFSQWMRSHFLAPYGSVFSYLGAKGAIVHPNKPEAIKVIAIDVSNGMKMYYDVKQQKLFATYSPSQYIAANRGMPPDAEKYFQAGKAVEIDINKPHASLQIMDFNAMQRQLDQAVGGTLTLAPAQQYTTEAEPAIGHTSRRGALQAAPRMA